MKRIYAILCAALAVSIVGCANDSDSVVSQAASAAIQRNSSASSGETAASVAGKISSLNTAGTHEIKIPASAVTSVNDIYTIKNAVHAKNAANSSIKVSLDFSECTFPNNTAISGLLLNYDNASSTTLPGLGLVGVIFPKNLEKIEGYILSQTGVTSITVPASVKYVDGYAFKGMTSLTSLTFESAVATQPTTWFTGSPTVMNCLTTTFSTKVLTDAAANATYFKNAGSGLIIPFPAFTQAYINEQKAKLNSVKAIAVENSTSTDVSKYQTVNFTDSYKEAIFKITTTASTVYNVDWCDSRTNQTDRTNVPANLKDCVIYFYDENFNTINVINTENSNTHDRMDDFKSGKFSAAGTTTYIYIKPWGSDSGTCAFRISK